MDKSHLEMAMWKARSKLCSHTNLDNSIVGSTDTPT